MANEKDLTRSPIWKKPSDVMKVRLKKRRTSSIENFQSLLTKAAAKTRLSSSEQDSSNCGNRLGKRRNPFGQEGGPPSRRKASQNAEDATGKDLHGCMAESSSSRSQEGDSVGVGLEESKTSTGVNLFQALTSEDETVFEDEKGQPHVEETEYQRVLKANDSSKQGEKDENLLTNEDQFEKHTSEFLPLDWSIKARARFTSPHPFTWSTPLKTMEEAKGLCSFVRCDKIDGEPFNKMQGVAAQQSHWKARLQQSLMLWSHPHLPWVKLFPRIMLRSKSSSTSFAAVDESIQKELMSSWSESFRSVFYLLRSGHCPYFYLLAHQYTVLFRDAGVGGVKQIHALFNPTTKGLREALREEGIEFSLPLANIEDPKTTQEDEFIEQYKQPSGDEGIITDHATSTPDRSPVLATEENGVKEKKAGENDDCDDEEEIGISQDDDGASSWLQSMGLDKQSFPTLEPSKVNFQRDQSMRIDNRPDSLALIQGPDTQALYNFLLNTRTTVATTGATAGVPPTLLAPVAFHGATLDSLKWKPGVMKHAVGNTLQESHSLEVTGPLLPHSVFGICKLLEESQREDFSGNFNNHEPTIAFSRVVIDDMGSEDRLEQNPMTQSECLSKFLAARGVKRCTDLIKELNCVDSLYKWC